MNNIIIQLTYLIATIMFIVGIKKLNKTQEARQGNILSAIAMLLAVLATLVDSGLLTPIETFSCMLVGGAIGLVWARRVEMTQMPEMVAIFTASEAQPRSLLPFPTTGRAPWSSPTCPPT